MITASSAISVEHIQRIEGVRVMSSDIAMKADVPPLSADAPVPTGYKILIAPVKVDNKTKSGLYIPDDVVGKESIATIVACVLAMGPDCYKDKKRFPSGPWCEVGDFIILKAYSGTRIQLGDCEIRLINDDSVEAVVADPRSIARAV